MSKLSTDTSPWAQQVSHVYWMAPANFHTLGISVMANDESQLTELLAIRRLNVHALKGAQKERV